MGIQTSFKPRACSWVSPNTKLSSLVRLQEKAISEGWIKENLKKKSSEELSKATGGLNLPLDFKLPF